MSRTLAHLGQRLDQFAEQTRSVTASQLIALEKRLRQIEDHLDQQLAVQTALSTASERLAAATDAAVTRLTGEFAQVRVDVDDVSWAVHEIAENLATMAERMGATVTKTDLSAAERRLRARERQEFAQVEALLNLYGTLVVRQAMPASRGWAASPDFLLLITSLVGRLRPNTVIDLGSGASTVWLAHAMRGYEVPGHIIAIDHEESYATATRDSIYLHELDDRAEVRHAPLTTIQLGDESWPWYDVMAFKDVSSCDLVIVDGPPGMSHPHARYPALPVLADWLRSGAHIAVDDYGRSEEREMVARWLAEFPGWSLREFPHEKGTALLIRR